jgi:hypothetical protein
VSPDSSFGWEWILIQLEYLLLKLAVGLDSLVESLGALLVTPLLAGKEQRGQGKQKDCGHGRDPYA